jgi:NAD(P)-dependent dehydrogenase (short-subunit alcohol dehydrogenase family)
MNAFLNRVVVITGAGRGIGHGLCQALATQGARVGAIDVRGEGLDDLQRDLAGRPLATAVADVTDAPGLREAVAQIEARLGPVDVLIANAGISHETPATDFPPESFAAVVRVNLIGVANSFAAVLPGMCRRRSGHLVAISSTASYRGVPLLAGYCASKAGVNALCDAFRVELRPLGIPVTTICPSFIDTDIAAHFKRLTHPRTTPVPQAVATILQTIARRQTFRTFPWRDAWLMWLLRVLPRSLADWIIDRYYRRHVKQPAEGVAPP